MRKEIEELVPIITPIAASSQKEALVQIMEEGFSGSENLSVGRTHYQCDLLPGYLSARLQLLLLCHVGLVVWL